MATVRRRKGCWRRSVQAIVFEDARLLAINKPSGIASHGGSGITFGVIETLRALRRATAWSWCTGWTATPPV